MSEFTKQLSAEISAHGAENGTNTKKKPRGIKPPTYPKDIEQLCARLESGEAAWVLANEKDATNAMLYYWYKQHRGITLSEFKAKMSIDEG
jgi:hypothetical protein